MSDTPALRLELDLTPIRRSDARRAGVHARAKPPPRLSSDLDAGQRFASPDELGSPPVAPIGADAPPEQAPTGPTPSQPPMVVPPAASEAVSPLVNSKLGAKRRILQVQTSANTLVLGPGSVSKGEIAAPSIAVGGRHSGLLHATKGPLLVLAGAFVLGHCISEGDAVIAGDLGSEESPIKLTVRGRLHLAEGCRVVGEVEFGSIAIYADASVRGTLVSLGSRQ